MPRIVALFAFFAALLTVAPLASAQEQTFCPPGQQPRFVFGFADLKAFIGEKMGQPLTCEFADRRGTGDVHQKTTQGLAFWRKSTNTPTFTNGWEHWAITDQGLVYWTGDSIDPTPDAAPVKPPAAQVAPRAAPAYSPAAVWDWYEHRDAIEAHCGVPFWDLVPERAPQQAACIMEAMRATDAHAEAVRFFQTAHLLLDSFDERGRVDTGRASAPWFNMGRSQIVFVNGRPSVMSIFDITPDDWRTHPAYRAVLRRFARLWPWPEYAEVTESHLLADGQQRMLVSYPLRVCRACPDIAVLRVAFTFDGRGKLVGTEILPARRT